MNNLKEEKLQIDSDLQQRYKLEEDKATLQSDNESHDAEVKDCKEQIRPIQVILSRTDTSITGNLVKCRYVHYR